MKIEDEVESSAYSPRHARYGAFILSLIWNFFVLFCIFFVARHQQNIIFKVPPNPLVIFQNPATPIHLPQNSTPPQTLSPQTQPSLIKQQLPQQTLQQIARQQPLDSPLPNQEELNYLVRQLISCGNEVHGAVVSVVEDVPGGADLPISQPSILPSAEESPKPENQSEANAEPESKEPESLEAPIQADNKEPEITNQPLSREDAGLLRETIQALETTLPVESTVHMQHSSSTNRVPFVPPSSSRSGYAQQRRAQSTVQQSNKRTVTLSDIAHSFMRQVRNEREIKYNYDPQKKSGGISGVNSPANRACDGKQLALQMYASKAFMMMQQSAHTLSSLIYAHSNFKTDSFLEITIDHDGKLLRVALNPPINEKDIEQAVQTIVQRVGLFPPIPKHFNTDTLTLTFPLNIQGSKGFGRYSLSYSVAGSP